MILVAHDRWFLEAVTTAVLELEAGRSTYFPGQWHVWRREKAARALDASNRRSLQRRHRAAAAIVDRFRYKKSKAKQAQAKLTHIGRLKKEKAVASDELWRSLAAGTLGFEFLIPPRSGKMVAEIDDLSLSAGDKHLLDDVTLAIDRGEHVALVGPNGAGKTTLLEQMLAAARASGSATVSCRRTSRSTRPSSTSAARCSSASRR